MTKATPKVKPDGKPKRPYTVSDKVISANRENSKRSTGPTSPEGKKRVGQNSRIHVLNYLEAVIEGEDPAELQVMGDFYVASVGAETPVEDCLCRQAAVATWRLRRAIYADSCALRGQILDARRDHRDRQRREVARLAARLAKTPTDVVTKLRESAAGCTYLIEQWTRFENRLKYSNSVLRSERERAVRLLGKRLCDLFDDEQVENWNLAYLASLPLPEGQKPDLKLALEIFEEDRPETILSNEFELRLAHWIKHLPERSAALETLKETVTETLAELTRRHKALEAEEAERIEIEAGKATVNTSVEGLRRLKYEDSLKREAQHCLELARSMRLTRLKGAFAETAQIGMSQALIDLMAGRAAAEDLREEQAEDLCEAGQAAPEVASPADPEMTAAAAGPDLADGPNPDFGSEPDPEFQSKADSELQMVSDQVLTTESGSAPKPVQGPISKPIPAPRPAPPTATPPPRHGEPENEPAGDPLPFPRQRSESWGANRDAKKMGRKPPPPTHSP